VRISLGGEVPPLDSIPQTLVKCKRFLPILHFSFLFWFDFLYYIDK